MADENKTPTARDDLKVEIRTPSTLASIAKKKWAQVGIALLVGSVLFSALMVDEKKPAPAPARELAVNTTPEGVTKKSWEAQSQAEISALRDQVKQLQSQNQDMEKLMKAINESTAKQTKALEAMQAEQSKAKTLPPPPPGKPGEGSVAGANGKVLPPPPPLPRNGSVPPSATPGAPIDEQPIILTAKQPETEQFKAEVQYKPNPYAGYLPEGSFAKVVLLNGLDSGSSDYTRQNPEPVLMRIQANAVLPGSSRYALKSCVALGSAYGDLASQRVQVRLARLSCVDNKGRLVLSSPLKGYVVDSDGSLGLRGKVIQRNGEMLNKSLLAGFAQGLSSAFGTAQGTVSTGATGAYSTVTGGDVLATAGFGGASSAANSLAQYYLDQAKNIFPVITVPVGRTGSIVVTEGVSLKWADYGSLFTKEYKPTK